MDEEVQDRELDQLKTNLLSTVSHELRTPLAAIKGYSTLLLDYDARIKKDEKREYLEEIDRATDRLAHLLESILDVSRLDAGMVKLDREECSIEAILSESADSFTPQGVRGRIVLQYDLGLPLVYVDRRRIRQVTNHMIENALKYSSLGSPIMVRASIVDGAVTVSIADKGNGIPLQDLNAIFSRMHRMEQRLTNQPGAGLGLGLALCKSLVELHGGYIWAESGEGRGSTFFFTVPANPPGDQA